FGFGADHDYGDATQVIAFAHSGGLGLPDRDYYLKADEKSKGIRAKYLAHVANMLELTGQSKAAAKKDAATVMRIETALAKASLTRVERREPHNLYHKMTVTALQKITPSFDWQAYLTAGGIGGVKTVNVTEPKFFKEMESELKTVPLAYRKA